MSSSDYILRTFRDYHQSTLLTEKISWNSSGKIEAQYSNPNGAVVYEEEIGQFDPHCNDREEVIRKIVNDNLDEVNKIFKGIVEQQIPIPEAIASGMFKAMRLTDAVCKEIVRTMRKREDFDRFMRMIEHRMRHDHYLRMNVFNPEEEQSLDPSDLPWYPVKKVEGRAVIRDYEMPIEAYIARLLLVNPYSKIAYPHLRPIVDDYVASRHLRLKFINMLLEGYAVQSNGIIVKDYELYWKNSLVFKKEGTNVDIYSQELFLELCSVPPPRMLYEVIDERFITNVIHEGYVPKESQKKLSRFIGHTFRDAVQLKSNVCGNFQRVQQIHHEEIDNLDSEDRELYESLYYMFNVRQSYYDLKSHETHLEEEDLYRRTKSLYKAKQKKWGELKKVFKYLNGSLGKESLSLSRESAPWLLKVIKMFDLALVEINCLRARKVHFERGSYALRVSILELEPEQFSCYIFSKTLFVQRLRNALYLAKPENWTDTRVGLQAKALVNMFVLARSLSERMPTIRMLGGSSVERGIMGARGNSASGKSTALGDHPGILTVDYTKWFLRRDGGRNKQIHAEGSLVFNRLFDEIKHRIDYFIIDMRLLDVKSLQRYLLEPAEQLQRPVMLLDLDAPLLTSLNRMLKRDPKGKEPCQNLAPIVDGFKSARKHREAIIECIENNAYVQEYYLTYLGKRVSAKVDSKLTIFDIDLYQECLRIPTEEEIESCLNRVIDDEYIREAEVRGDLKVEELHCLKFWKGYRIRDAVEKHANA